MAPESSSHCVLVINGGSSSLKFALYRVDADPVLLLTGKFDRIHLEDGTLTCKDGASGRAEQRSVDLPDRASCLPSLTEIIGRYAGAGSLKAVGHRVVHGGPRLTEPIIRARIREGLQFLGIRLDRMLNQANAGVISMQAERLSSDHQVTVRVVPTDEELLIARQTCRRLNLE